MSIPFVASNRAVEFELQNNGRVLILKDALLNPATNRYHNIKIDSHGYTFLGFDLGGGKKFTGITQDVARQIQMTYGIVLKTLHANPSQVTFSGNEKSTKFVIENESKESWFGRGVRKVTSYPLGEKKNDILIGKEDVDHFNAKQMTLHDAVARGIWNAFYPQPLVEKTEPEKQKTGVKDRKKNLSISPGKKGPFGKGRKCQTSETHDSKKKKTLEEFQKKSPISTLPPIPVYRAKSTPIVGGYDDAPFDERRQRIIDHLDQSSPIPFSAFVDRNLQQRIDAALFHRLSDAIRRLAVNPKATDPDAKYMKQLFKHWLRAAYHYLDQNSKPGDGYSRILSKVSKTIKDPKKAQAKAKEFYWRYHATLFWMTLIDQFAEEHTDIDPLHQVLSEQVSLNPWFFN